MHGAAGALSIDVECLVEFLNAYPNAIFHSFTGAIPSPARSPSTDRSRICICNYAKVSGPYKFPSLVYPVSLSTDGVQRLSRVLCKLFTRSRRGPRIVHREIPRVSEN
jgi:hypothetical protein